MKLYVGLDVSLATTAICVIDEHGRQVKMTSAGSDPHSEKPRLRGAFLGGRCRVRTSDLLLVRQALSQLS